MKAYSFLNTIVLVNGIRMTNWSDDDDALTIERLEDAAMHKVGVDGKMSVAISANKSGQITIKLMQTSPSNKFLNALHGTQGEGPFTFVPITVAFSDLYRQDSAVAAAGYLKKLPDIKRGGPVNVQEWAIVVERLDVLLGDPAFAGMPTAVAEAL